MSFAGIRIVTLAEGEISELHIGLKGTMNALFLKDLADKTRRGLRGRVELGRSGGGLCYGYTIVENGERGGREILQAEAAVVRRIFADFAAGPAAVLGATQQSADMRSVGRVSCATSYMLGGSSGIDCATPRIQ